VLKSRLTIVRELCSLDVSIVIHAVLYLIRVLMLTTTSSFNNKRSSLLEEEWTVAEDINYSFDILITHFGILGSISGVNLDVHNELKQEIKRESEAVICNLK